MNFEPLRALLIRHEQVLFAQAQQSAGCNASHSVEARMCRWLLYMRDLAGEADLRRGRLIIHSVTSCSTQAIWLRLPYPI